MEKLFLTLLLLLSVSCSMNNAEKVSDDFDDWDDESDEVGRSISSTPEETAQETDNFLKDDENQELFEDDKGDGVFVYSDEVPVEPNPETEIPKEEKPSSRYNGKYFKYTVKKGDTLMWIAFKVYGDYSKWKEIRRINSDKIENYSKLDVGTILSYTPAKNPYVRPIGNPYLIKYGDTLGKVSKKVYGTKRKWKSIWRNNSRQIKNPDLIFAGFTLFYVGANAKKIVYAKQ